MERRIEIPSTREFLISVGRAFAGALLFALPMLMTMEMWELGVSLHPWRVDLLLILTLPLLLGLSRVSGIRYTAHWRDELADVLVAILVSSITAVTALWVFGVITTDMSVREIVAKLAMQFVPCSIGAMLARSQLGSSSGSSDKRDTGSSYGAEMFLMMVGALFLSLNVAPTEEMILIAYQMTPLQQVLLIIASLVVMQVFVYAAHFRGGHEFEGMSMLSVFARYTVVGYILVLAVSMGLMWLLGRTDGNGLEANLSACIVVGFPGAIGAAAARLVL